MQTKSRTVFLAAWLFAAALPACAANPTLDAYERGIEDPGRHSKALRVASLDLKVDIVGATAETTVTARFVNPSDDLLEGRFNFELPEGAVVTGYALDVAGHMIDGVLVDPLQAKREYQEKVRQGIDPGVAKVSRGNVFSSTIYPLMAGGHRTVRLRFSAPIQAQRGLTIPLSTPNAVGSFVVDLRADAQTRPPDVSLPDDLGAAWAPSQGGFAAMARIAGRPLNGRLHLAPRSSAGKALLSRHANGTRFFEIIDAAPEIAVAAGTARRVRVYWDRSLSRRDDKLADEIALLDKYFAAATPASIDLVIFNSSGARVQHTTRDEIGALLRGVLYRGATSFAVLDHLDAPVADACLVFSDGVVTIDPRREFNPGCEVFALASAPDADRGFLKRLTRGDGAVLRIGVQSEAEILARLAGVGPRVIDARAEDGRALRFTAFDGGAHGWAVIGEAPEKGAVILKIAGLGRAVLERRYATAEGRAARFSGAGALWAADRVAQLGAEDAAHAAFVRVSRQFSVASPMLSFIVLERPEDYVQARIAPPANYPKEALEDYRQARADFDAERKAEADGRIDAVIGKWHEQQEWWNTRFEPAAPRKAAEKSAAIGPGEMASGQTAPGAPVTVQREAAPQVDSITAEDIGSFRNRSAGDVDEVIVTGFRASLQSSMEMKTQTSGAQIGVQMEEWNPDRPYLKALDAAAPAEIERVLAREERRNAAIPAFYFDVAEWLYRRKRGADAVEMLLSALELRVANEETVSMVADRLLRYGKIERALWLYERACQESDYLPQPRRTLALALAKRAAVNPQRARADLTRAVELLNEVVTTPWEDDYDGIELIALMDANMLLPRLEKLGVTRVPLDERLRALLDVDIRVIIEWNTDASDMDLWVDEPGGERAIYSHPRTAIGGRLSNDMTRGFGPEEYLLHRAVPGDYRISANVYAADSINPNGTTVVTAHLIRNYGRTNQAEEVMELDLKPGDEGLKVVGNFKVN